MKNENKYWENEEGEVIKFGIDRSELSKSKEGLPYLREVLEEWQEWADENDD